MKQKTDKKPKKEKEKEKEKENIELDHDKPLKIYTKKEKYRRLKI